MRLVGIAFDAVASAFDVHRLLRKDGSAHPQIVIRRGTACGQIAKQLHPRYDGDGRPMDGVAVADRTDEGQHFRRRIPMPCDGCRGQRGGRARLLADVVRLALRCE